MPKRNYYKNLKKRMNDPITGAYGDYDNISVNAEKLKKDIQDRLNKNENNKKLQDASFTETVKNNGIKYGDEASHITTKSEELYNEISFNVLENAAKGNIKNPVSQNYKSLVSSKEVLEKKQGSLTEAFGSKSSVYKSGVVSKAKSRFVFPIAIGVLIFAILGCIIYSGVFGRVYENRSPIKVVFNEIANVDKNLVKLNDILGDEITSDTLYETKSLENSLWSNYDKLDALQSRTEQIQAEAEAGSDESGFAPYALTAIEARRSMITSGLEILSMADDTVDEISKIDTFWSESIKGNDLLCEADDILSQNDTALLFEATQKSQEAVASFTKAQLAINDFSSDEINVEQYKNFADLALNVANLSLQTCNSMSSENVDDATTANEQYLEQKSVMADAASSLDKNPAQVLRASYNLRSQKAVEAYKNARNSASSVDQSIRDYLNR